jgi:hypothetical protein
VRPPAPRPAAALLAASALLAAAPARAEPSDRALVAVGVALVPPTYLLGVTLHEGSHAVAGWLAGGEIIDVHLFPPRRDPRSKQFRFGWVYARGLRTRAARTAFFLAPKVTDAVLLGGFAGLVLTDAWPASRYGQLALTVLATGLWVDFSKDLLALSRHNDVVKVAELWGIRGWRQLPARIVYAGAVTGLGLLVARGFARTFDGPRDEPASPQRAAPPAFVVPVTSLAF